MRFLGPHSAAEGPHLVPISLKIGSPMGPLFDNLGSQWHVATVKTGSLTDWKPLYLARRREANVEIIQIFILKHWDFFL